MPSEQARALDFIVIGAQKGGTTSLWRYLRDHPEICMPRSKEAPFFIGTRVDPDRLVDYMRVLFGDAPAGARLGKATPDYMIGHPGAPVDVVAERIAAAFPEVRLVAILRDPIERAVSSYGMAVRREQEGRSVDAALGDQLDPDELAEARLNPDPTNSYVAAGEYGRILGAYRERFPAGQLLVTFTEDLAQDPGAVLDDVLRHLDLPPGFHPEGLGARHFPGGPRKIVSSEAEKELFRFHREEILPFMRGSATLHRRAFEFFFETWNVAPGDPPPQVAAEVRSRLESHYRRDAERLAALGLSAPWIDRWGREGRRLRSALEAWVVDP
jgi:hypothetical protein